VGSHPGSPETCRDEIVPCGADTPFDFAQGRLCPRKLL
jgi:hypothetical protein